MKKYRQKTNQRYNKEGEERNQTLVWRFFSKIKKFKVYWIFLLGEIFLEPFEDWSE
jgi:hypothetical protein